MKKKPFLPRIVSVRGGRGSGTIMELWKWRDPRIVGGVIPERAFRLVEGSHARTRTIESNISARGASSGLWYPRPPRIALHCSQRIASRHKVNMTTKRYLPAAESSATINDNRVVRRSTGSDFGVYVFRTSFRFFIYPSICQHYCIRHCPKQDDFLEWFQNP